MRAAMRMIVLSCIALSFGACDGPIAAGDAGHDASIPDAGPPDAGAFDPSASFAPATTSADGPWGVWGFMAVPIASDRAVVLGGTDAGPFGGDVYDGAWMVTIAEGEVSASAIEATGPAPRYCGCAAYDPSRDVVVVFGGRDLSGPTLAPETWELALATSTWTQLAPATQPPGTIGCAMAWSPSAESIYLFGGGGTAGFSADTYRYEAGEWTLLDASGPVARYDGVMLPASDGSLLLFGGAYGAVGAAFYADLWRFDPSAEAWSEIVLPDGPLGRRAAWIVRDPDREGLYVGFGYDGDMNPYADLWYVDLDARTWTSIAVPEEGPGARGFSPALPGGSSALGTVIGGLGPSSPASSAWQLVR